MAEAARAFETMDSPFAVVPGSDSVVDGGHQLLQGVEENRDGANGSLLLGSVPNCADMLHTNALNSGIEERFN